MRTSGQEAAGAFRHPGQEPKSLSEVRMVAGFGGFLNRKGDVSPGSETISIGLPRARDFA